MRCIVTGGAGFIGSHLTEFLIRNNHEVIVLDNLSTGRIENLNHLGNNFEFLECDLSIKGKWIDKFISIDWVFHLAALADIVPSIKNPEEYFNSNVNGTLNVLQASKKHNIKKIVYSASSSCYGIAKITPTSENEPINPQYPYALTKFMGEELMLHWSNLYKIPTISLRFFNVYGTRSRTSGTYGAVFGVFLAQKLADAPFTIVGDGTQTRDFTYVTDVVKALYSAVKSNSAAKVYNVGSGKTVSINSLVELIGGKFCKKTFIPKRPGEPDCTFADITKIKNDLNWSPLINIEDGVKKILENIDYWKEAPVWTPETISNETKNWFKYLGK